VVLGNSILYSPKSPEYDWNGDWGMAASALDSDYVHILIRKLKANDPKNDLQFKNIANFEREFDTFDMAKNLQTLRDYKPDLLVVRISENVTRTADSVLFAQKYAEMLNYFRAGNPDVKILAVGSVWPDRDMAEKVLKKNSDYISLAPMQSNNSYYAYGLFTHPGVASHPSNKGMRYIADRIWEGAIKLIPDL
jgi:hypothetical protein